MTVKSGFFDSVGNDRAYNAEDLSSIFDGIVTDGVFQGYGNALMVVETTGMTVQVGTGRAWFNHTWTLNDTDLSLVIDPAEVALNRIDSIIIEVNKTSPVRLNTIKILKGVPGSTPNAPSLSQGAGVYQYALATIYVGQGVTSISQANITNKRGTTETPFITTILDTVSVEELMAQYETQFTEWFADLQNELDSNQAANLQSQITALEADVEELQSQAATGIENNYLIVPSVTSNNLTVEIKTPGGLNPSINDSIRFIVGSTVHTLSAAASIICNAGANYCNLGAQVLGDLPHDVFLYAIDQTGAGGGLRFGFSRIPYATKMGDFVNSTTDQKYIVGNHTAFTATDKVANIGRFKVQLTVNVSYFWSIPASANVINRPIMSTDRSDFNQVWTGFSSPPTNPVMHYILSGDVVTIWTRNATGGTSNATAMQLQAPFVSPNIANAIWTDVARCQDSGSIQANPCLLQIVANSNSLIYRKSYSSSSDDWTATGTKNVLTSKVSFPLR
jgi:hypothetical protein